MRYSFGDCELDADLRCLRRGDREVRLQPKVLDLLLFLVRHRGRMVSKGVLFRELWPDATVTEASLTRLVKEARKAIGDDGRRQGVLKTRHGRGYCFVADVEMRNGDDTGEQELVIELARTSLEAALELGALDIRERVRDFASVCERAIRAAREQAVAAGRPS